MNAVTDTPKPTPTATRIAEPNGFELCDRCGASALWRVQVAGSLELLFCGHHARKHGFAGDDSHAAYQGEERTKGSDH